MGDDLSQFFAKKTAKAKEKKKKVRVSVDEVGQVLERKARLQEERDREVEEEERRAQDDAAFFEKRTEDSEWLEYTETNKEILLEELGIRDMNLTEQNEEAFADEKATPAEAPKTWCTAENKESEELPMPPVPQKPEIYKPRHLMQVSNRASAVPNINDQEMFPTFEAAEKMEKQMKKSDDKKRRNDGFTTVTSDRDASNAWSSRNNMSYRSGTINSNSADRAALFSAVRQVTSSGAPNPVPPPRRLGSRNANAYVPPARRRAQANTTTADGRQEDGFFQRF